MRTYILCGLGAAAWALVGFTASCSDRFDGCDKNLSCPDALGGGLGGEGAHTGGTTNTGGATAGGTTNAGEEDTEPCDGLCDEDTPICLGGSCVECTEDHPCATGHCDLQSNSCVQCLDDADCEDPDEPACIDGSCAPCTEHDHCSRFSSTPTCHDTSGKCVKCTTDTELEQCAAFSCSSITNTCTSTPRGNLDACDPCEADSECATGRGCVQHVFNGTDVGHFCFLKQEMGGCGNTVPARRPYSTPRELKSIDGVDAVYCMPPPTTSCQGIKDTRSKPCATSSGCGVEGLDDGYCPDVGADAGLCSYECAGDVDCRNTLSCGGTPDHCRL